MNDPLPNISVLFITYRRIDLLKQTYNSFITNTDYPCEKLELIICDDGSPEEIQNELRKIRFDKYLMSEKNEGMGANVNKGIKAATGKYILQLQDDWLLKGPKDYLLLGVKALDENEDIGLIRYRLGVNYPNYKQRNLNDDTSVINILDWDQGDKNISTFIYSDNPHLKKSSLHEKIGYYTEAKKMYRTEIEFCERYNRLKFFKAAYLVNYENIFHHIGDEHSLRRNYKLEFLKKYLSENRFTRKIYDQLRYYRHRKSKQE